MKPFPFSQALISTLCLFIHPPTLISTRARRPVVSHAGYVLLIENTRSSNPMLGYYQDITASAAANMGGKGTFPVLFTFSHSSPPKEPFHLHSAVALLLLNSLFVVHVNSPPLSHTHVPASLHRSPARSFYFLRNYVPHDNTIGVCVWPYHDNIFFAIFNRMLVQPGCWTNDPTN